MRLGVFSFARLNALCGGLQDLPLLGNGLAGPNGTSGKHEKRPAEDFGFSQPVSRIPAVEWQRQDLSEADGRLALSPLPGIRSRSNQNDR
jgi:hypothetical protein